MGKLTDTQVKAAKPKEKDYKLYDGEGLYVLVKPNSNKYWRLKYRFGGKEKVLALGVYPKISLAQARQSALKEKSKLIDGIDPSHERKVRKLTANLSNDNTFSSIADEFVGKKMQRMSKVHINRTTRAINRDLKPFIGSRPISEITAPELLSILRKVEERGAVETAHRIKQVAGQIFRYAIATGRAERDISTDLKGALGSPEKKHFAAIVDPKEVSKLLIAIDNYKGTAVVTAALKLSPLLFCRPGELRHLEWDEINFMEDRIELPAEKMKIKEPLIIPLSTQALAILNEIKPLTSNGRYVFPSARGNSRPMSDNAIRTALRTLGYDNETMTTHGFRAMARTLLDEVLSYRIDIIEQQLGHAVKDANGRAYNRTKHLNERTQMMQKWSDYLWELRYD